MTIDPRTLPCGTAVQYTDGTQTRLAYIREGGYAHYTGGPTVPWSQSCHITAVLVQAPPDPDAEARTSVVRYARSVGATIYPDQAEKIIAIVRGSIA